jgi:hypothetical protein
MHRRREVRNGEAQLTSEERDYLTTLPRRTARGTRGPGKDRRESLALLGDAFCLAAQYERAEAAWRPALARVPDDANLSAKAEWAAVYVVTGMAGDPRRGVRAPARHRDGPGQFQLRCCPRVGNQFCGSASLTEVERMGYDTRPDRRRTAEREWDFGDRWSSRRPGGAPLGFTA